MLDIRTFRETPDVVRADLRKRGRDTDVVDRVIELDEAWREGTQRLNDLRAKRNASGKAVAAAKKAGEDVQAVLHEMAAIKTELEELEADVPALLDERDTILRRLPNLMHDSVPVGADDSENQEIASWGGKPEQAHRVSHVDLLTETGWGDLEKAAEVAGARFFYLHGDLVLLAKAIEFYALQTLAAKGYQPMLPPYMLRRASIEAATDLSDFEDVIYKIEDEDLYLTATSEHSVASFHMGEIIESDRLPLRYAGTSPCFRKEAGAHGKDTKGIFRVHQFEKVEQFVFCKPEDSWTLHEELLGNARALMEALEIPYRIVNICTGDLGTVAAKKYDLEAWMPVQQTYRELVSCSNCTDYQARRYNIRHRKNPGDPTELVHTLNSTAVAIQRTLVAILENHQQEDGRVQIPAVLHPLLGGKTHLEPLRIPSLHQEG